MDRLTRWNGKKYVLPQGRGAWREIADRLAAYENTGLKPEEIEALKAQHRAKPLTCDNCVDMYDCPESQSGAFCIYGKMKEES